MIDWAALGQVFLISFGVAVGVIVVFSFGVTALTGGSSGADGQVTRRPAPILVAGLCFLVCALVVAYGLYLVIKK